MGPSFLSRRFILTTQYVFCAHIGILVALLFDTDFTIQKNRILQRTKEIRFTGNLAALVSEDFSFAGFGPMGIDLPS